MIRRGVCLGGLALAACLGTPIMVGGCAFLKKTIGWVVSRPRVELKQLAVKKASLAGVELAVSLLVHNPNDFDLTLSDLRYTLAVDHEQLAEGAYRDPISIPAEDSQTITLPVTIGPAQSIKILQQLLQGKKPADAHWQATALFASPLGPIELSLNEHRALSS